MEMRMSRETEREAAGREDADRRRTKFKLKFKVVCLRQRKETSSTEQIQVIGSSS